MKSSRKLAVVVSILVGLAIAVGLASLRPARADETTFKWVIISTASAKANDNSQINLTGNGTFQPGEADQVTGGGTWQTVAPDGVTVTGSGNFVVRRLVRFDLAPGAVANPTIHAGLAFLQVDYMDGSQGVLVVSCHLPGTPASVFEGATASKGFTDFWNRIPAGAFFQVVTQAD
jgi:hypothetical protein